MDYKTKIKFIEIVFVSSFIISKYILGLFDEALMAMLQCVAIDMDLHDGIPIYGPAKF